MSKQKKLALFVDRAKHTLPPRQKIVFDIEVDLDTRDLSWDEKAELANTVLEGRYKKRSFAPFDAEDYKNTLDYIKKTRSVKKAMNVAVLEQRQGDLIERFVEDTSDMSTLDMETIDKYNKIFNIISKYNMDYLKAKDLNRRYNYQKKKEQENKENKETIKDPATGKVIDVSPEE